MFAEYHPAHCRGSRKRAVIDALLTVTIHVVGRGRRNFDPASVGIEWRVAS